MAKLPVSRDRPPAAHDNPRHAVWIEDDEGLRLITAANPGEERLNLNGVIYTHTSDFPPTGRWVYTKVPV